MSEEKPEQCSCCRFETNELTFYEGDPWIEGTKRKNNNMWLCDLCYTSMLGTSFEYYNNHDDEWLEAMKHNTFLTNKILEAIKNK